MMKLTLKKVRTKIKSVACFFLVGILMLGISLPTYATTDTEAPEIDLNSIKLNKTVFDDPHESPHISIKIYDASEIQTAALSYTINGKLNAANIVLEYNSATGYYEGTIQYENYDSEAESMIGYYGDYVLYTAYAVDIYGNTTNLYGFDAPAGNFSVVSNGPKDETAPTIDYDNIEIKSAIAEGEKGSISVPIYDDSRIYRTYAVYTHKNSASISKTVVLNKNANGKYEAKISFEEGERSPQGCYQLAYIYAVDAFFNEVYLYNTSNNHFNEGDNAIFNRVLRSLENLDFVYGVDAGNVESDISIKSITVSNRFYNKGTVEKVTIEFESKTEIHQATVMYYLNEMQSFSTGMEKVGPNTYIATMPLYLYGNWHLAMVEVSDVHGNTFKLNDKRDIDFTDGIATDLSDGDCYVGIMDEETGVCISNSEMDDTTTLSVEEQSLEGEFYVEMLGEGCTGIEMYELQVDGKIGAGTAVAFKAPNGLKDGDEVTVVHKKHDGTIETFEVIVEDGLIVIETDEFSPFLIKVTGSWAPPVTGGDSSDSSGTGGEDDMGDSSGAGNEGGTGGTDTDNEGGTNGSGTGSGEGVGGSTDAEDEEDTTDSSKPNCDETSKTPSDGENHKKPGISPIVIVAICVAVMALGAGGFVFVRKKYYKG